MTDEQIRGWRLWFDLCKNGKDLVEIRLIEPVTGKTYSGYFDNVDTIIEALRPYENTCNCYWVLNAINPACFSRAQHNKFIAKPKETTSDKDIVGYDWIFIDVDVDRPSGVMSTDEELTYAKAKANEIYKYLRSCNITSVIVAVSGSGVHVLVKVNLKNTPERHQLVKNFLDAIGMMFSDEKVHIDGAVANPARLCRSYFWMNRKGESTEQRPHRMAYIAKYSHDMTPTEPEYLEKIAALLPQKELPSRDNHYRGSDSFNLEEFFQKYNIKITKKVELPAYIKYVLAECPWDSTHKAPDSCVLDFRGQGYQFVCLHQSHRHLNFRDFRMFYDKTAYSREVYSEYVHKRNYYGVRPPFVPEPITEEKGNPWQKMSDIKKSEINADEFIPFGIKTLDDLVIGQHLGQVYVWSGRRGCAKSTVLNQVLLGGANRGARCALITRELSDGETKNWMMLQASGKQYNQKSKFKDFFYTPLNVIRRIEPWLDQYLRVYNNNYKGDILNLEERVRELYREWPFQILAIDNLMSIEIDDLGENSEWNNQKKLLNKLTNLARELNIVIHLVAHPNKNRDWIDCDSISGSGNISNYAQNVLLVSRIYPDTFENQAKNAMSKEKIQDILASECTNIIEIAKCRDKGSAMGKVIKLWFEIESNRLKSDPYEVINYNWQETAHQTSIEDLPSYELQDVPFSSNFSEPSYDNDPDGLTPTDEVPF